MSSIFPFNATATPEIYTLSLHDALPIYYFGMSVPYQFGESVLLAWFYLVAVLGFAFFFSSLFKRDRKSTRLNSSHQIISYAVFCLKKKKRLALHVLQQRYRTVVRKGLFA